MKAFFATAILMTTALSSVSIGTTDSIFDPGRITWWKSQWVSSPITTSSVHVGSVTLSFHFKLTNSISEGVLEISGPGMGRTLSRALSASAGNEISESVTLYALSVGMMGPFKVITRHSSGGQIVDANYAFGSVYFAPAYTTGNSLTVEDASSAPVAIPAHGAVINLNFAFSIDYDMWEHDLIEIDVPKHMNDGAILSVSSNPTCMSLDPTNETPAVNSLCPNTSETSCNLQCEYYATSTVFRIVIYGLNKSLNYVSTPINAKIGVNSFNLPSKNFAGSEFIWTLRTKRFGTNFVYKEYTGAGPNTITSIATSTITVGSAPHRGMASSKLFNRMSIYMDFVFTTSSIIPASGTLTAIFNGLNIGYFPDDLSTRCVTSVGTCITSGYTLIVNAGDTDLAAGTITTTVYATFNANAASATVESKIGSRLIDATINYPITMGDTASTTEGSAIASKIVLGVSLSDDTALNKGSNEMAFKIAIIPSAAVATTDALSFNCPIDNSGLSKTKLYISSTAFYTTAKQLAIIDATTTGIIDETLDVSGAAGATTYSIGADSISVASNDMIAVTTDEVYVLGIIEDNSSDSVRAPMVTGNKITYYECHGSIGSSGKALNTATPFEIVDNDSIIVGNLLCKAADTQGIPLVVTITADTVDLADTDYTITLSGASYFGLGTGAASTATGWKMGGIVSVSFTETLMTVTGFGVAVSSAALVIYLPQGDGNTSGDLSIFYTSSGVDHVVSKKAANVADSAVADYGGTPANPPEVALFGSNDDVGQTIAINIPTYEALGDADIIGIGKMPPWWDVTGVSFTTDATAAAVINTGYISSTDPKFTGQTVFAIAVDAPMGAGTENVFAGIVAKSENQDAMNTYNVIVIALGTDVDCDGAAAVASGTLDIVPTVFTSITLSPSTSAAKGPGVFGQTVSIAITLHQPIPQGGKIEFDPLGFWEYPRSKCAVAGLVDIDSSTAVTCTSGVPYTITNFQEAAASTVVIVTITNANPSSTSAIAAGGTCLGTIISYDAMSNKINENPSPSHTACSSTPANAIGQSSFGSNSVLYYPNSGTRTADVYMAFSVTYALPEGSIIKITAPTTPTADKNRTFANFKYRHVTTSGLKILITTAEFLSSGQSLEFYFDSVVTAGAVGRTGDWRVATSYQGQVYTDDYQVTSIPNKFTVVYGAAGADISDGSITATIKTPGEYSSYEFTYTTPVAIEASDTIWVVFPMTYDPNIGHTQEYYSGDWRIQCSSTTFASLICKVDHWMVIVSGMTAVNAGSKIDLTIDFVKNPAPVSAAVFSWVHIDGDGTTVDAIADNFSTFTVEVSPRYLDLRSVNNSEKKLSKSSDYTFLFYVDTNIETLDEIHATFPTNYDLNMYNEWILECSATFSDESASQETATNIDSGVTACTVHGNKVQWTASSKIESIVDLDSHYRAELVLKEIKNAHFGLSRTYARPYYDLLDTAISAELFTEYQSWSSTFEVSIYDSSAKAISYKSFAQRNSAYVGYGDSNTSSISLQVASYNAITMTNRLMVNAGQMSQEYSISFTNGLPLIADQLNITGNAYPLSLYVANTTTGWTFNLLDSSLNFRVSASSDTPPSILYITFDIAEESQGICQTNTLYVSGPKVMVEVETSAYAVDTPTSVTFYNGTDSSPIEVSLPYPPHTDVTVNFYFITDSEQTIFNSVSFSTGEYKKYMTIMASLPAGSYEGYWYLTGTDKAAYSIATIITINVLDSATLPNSISPATISTSNVGSNSATVTIEGGGDGVSYLSIKCTQSSSGYTRSRSLAEMKATLTSAGVEVYDPIREEMSYNTTSKLFYQYLKDVTARACYTEQYVSMAHTASGGSSHSFDWLVDGQEYLAIAYVESYGQNTNSTARFTTGVSSLLKRYTVVATSATNLTEDDTNYDRIACELADNLKVSQHYLDRHTATSATNTADTTLIESTYTMDLMYNRLDTANNPTKFASFLGNTATVANNIKSQLPLLGTGDTLSLTVEDIGTGSAPSIGNTRPFKSGQSSSSISFEWTEPSSSGQWCVVCVAESTDNEASIRPDENSIPYGLSAGYNKSAYACTEVTPINLIIAEVSSLAESTNHYCYHTLCTNSKILPVCAEITLSDEFFSTSHLTALSFISLILISTLY